MKIVVNCCWGGFSISDAAIARCLELDFDVKRRPEKDEDRANPILVQVVE